MSDLFHEDVSDDFIREVFTVMEKAHWHTFQVLTKRPERMKEFMLDWAELPDDAPEQYGTAPNIWLGVSVEDQANADKRIPILLQTPSAVRFLSCEPLLGPVDLTNAFHTRPLLNWIIVGGESGKQARPFNINWARDIMRQCKDAAVPCFVKQLGAQAVDNHSIDMGLRDSHGGDMNEWPDDLKVRQWPDERVLA
jgi:protein gp37